MYTWSILSYGPSMYTCSKLSYGPSIYTWSKLSYGPSMYTWSNLSSGPSMYTWSNLNYGPSMYTSSNLSSHLCILVQAVLQLISFKYTIIFQRGVLRRGETFFAPTRFYMWKIKHLFLVVIFLLNISLVKCCWCCLPFISVYWKRGMGSESIWGNNDESSIGAE